MSGDALSKKIEQAIDIIAKQDPDAKHQVCTGWILVTEWSDFSGEKFIATHTSDGLAPWTAIGMMYYSIENDIYENEEDDDD